MRVFSPPWTRLSGQASQVEPAKERPLWKQYLPESAPAAFAPVQQEGAGNLQPDMVPQASTLILVAQQQFLPPQVLQAHSHATAASPVPSDRVQASQLNSAQVFGNAFVQAERSAVSADDSCAPAQSKSLWTSSGSVHPWLDTSLPQGQQKRSSPACLNASAFAPVQQAGAGHLQPDIVPPASTFISVAQQQFLPPQVLQAHSHATAASPVPSDRVRASQLNSAQVFGNAFVQAEMSAVPADDSCVPAESKSLWTSSGNVHPWLDTSLPQGQQKRSSPACLNASAFAPVQPEGAGHLQPDIVPQASTLIPVERQQFLPPQVFQAHSHATAASPVPSDRVRASQLNSAQVFGSAFVQAEMSAVPADDSCVPAESKSLWTSSGSVHPSMDTSLFQGRQKRSSPACLNASASAPVQPEGAGNRQPDIVPLAQNPPKDAEDGGLWTSSGRAPVFSTKSALDWAPSFTVPDEKGLCVRQHEVISQHTHATSLSMAKPMRVLVNC